jgi:nucleotide-binding universal stress UspA family protein
VLVPTDFSKGAELALKRALLLPLAEGARIHLIHILPPGLSAKARARVTASARHTLDEVVSRARGEAAGRAITLTSELTSGEAFVEIIRTARRLGAELIVLGRHGLRPIRDMFIGTTAERVIRKGDVPVLAVNLDPTHPYRRPLIATDLEDASRRTVELTLRVLGPGVKNLNVVHAFDVPFEGFITPSFSAREKSSYRKSFKENAEARLQKFLAAYKNVDLRWKATVRLGDARLIVLGEVARHGAELVALGTHGRSGVAHALVGSVAEWVIAAAPCDVLVARPVRFSFELP